MWTSPAPPSTMMASPCSTQRDDVRRLPDGGDAERAGDDGDVAGRPAFFQDEAAHALAVVVEELGRAHRAGDDDRVARQVAAAPAHAAC